MDPQNKVVIITGASSGIGAAAARVFAQAGADVVLAARSADRLEQLAAQLPGRPLALPADLGDVAQAHALIEQAIAAHGRLDILINNAGIGLAGPVASISPADLDRIIQVDVSGPLHTIQAAIPHMKHQERGQIINVSSVLGIQALPYLGGYAAAKAALDRLTEALRIELHGSGIAVTLFRPGTTRTDFATHRLGSGSEHRRIAPRGVSPDRVARALLRAARREPRVAYVTLADRLQIMLSRLAPWLVEPMLARTFSWHEPQDV